MNTQLVRIIKQGMEQGLTPLALAHRIEKEMNMPKEHLCHDCGKPMQPQPQNLLHSSEPMLIVTCWNRNCTLWGVTLSTTQYESTTEERWEEYRQTVAGIKSRFSKEF